MPSCSISRATKLKSVSRYCTQYSQGSYFPRSLSRSSADLPLSSENTASMMSGTFCDWKILQSVVRVRNHSHGFSVIR